MSLAGVASGAGTGTLPSFPGAEGAGATTPGGRAGRVIFVTNLHDAGPGSLREACEAEGPRTVLFRVAGTIVLESPIVVRHPFLTLAGQSAPGEGICLRDYTFVVATHDVILRYLRSRLGDTSGQQADCIDLGNGAHDVVLDHCSATWSVDEALSLSGKVADVTVQWCLIGQSLRRSIHAKGPHGYGSLSRANGRVTWHHNLWIHNDARNPRLGDDYGRPPYPVFDVRNNVIYDFGHTASGLTQGRLRVNYVANFIRPGPSSVSHPPIRVGGPSDLRFFLEGNVVDGDAALTADNARFFDPVEIDGRRQVRTVAEPFAMPAVTTQTAREALESVLASVGASRPARDTVDARLIEEVRHGTGRIIDSQQEVGGWPELKTGEPAPDADDDGMPDAWEAQHGLDAHDAADGATDRDSDGYTNLEEYLHALAAGG